MRSAITALAAKLRKEASGMSGHAAATAEQQQESAAQVDSIDADYVRGVAKGLRSDFSS